MDLVEFLLTRIAEDEAGARRLQARYDRDELAVPAALVNAQALAIPARVLAECDASRRIVAALGDFNDGYIWASGEASRAEDALLALALPYADHPDYREEWKP